MIPIGILSRKPLTWFRKGYGEELGAGGFGVVWGFRTKEGKKIAVKEAQFFEERLGTDPSLLREASLLNGLKHPNILPLKDIFFTHESMNLVFPRAYENLKKYIGDNFPLPVIAVKSIMLQIMSAILYLHSYDILHGDLKPQNILIQPSQEEVPQIWVADFGIAITGECQKRERSKFFTGPYEAPELRLDGRYTKAADIYAIGVIFYELLTKRIYHVSHLRGTTHFQGDPINVEDPIAKEIAASMLTINPDQRPNLSQIADHPWFVEGKQFLQFKEEIVARNCPEILISQEALIPVTNLRDIYDLKELYHFLLTKLKNDLHLSDRTIALIITMFESTFYLFGPDSVYLLLYFQAVVSLVTQVTYLNNSIIEKYIFDWVQDKKNVEVLKREILALVDQDRHPGLDFFLATSYDLTLTFLNKYRSPLTKNIALTLLQLSYYTNMSRHYRPLFLADLYIYFGSTLSEEKYGKIREIEEIQSEKEFDEMAMHFQGQLKSLPNLDLLGHCSRGGIILEKIIPRIIEEITRFVNS